MLTKQEVKTLAEADDQLQWWAMVLFAEVSDLAMSADHGGYDATAIYPLIVQKVKEFERIVVRRQVERAAKPDDGKTLEERVAELERRVFGPY
jgi:hypothetical protein